MLSKDQVTHFETFGFLVLRNVFSRDEVDIMQISWLSKCSHFVIGDTNEKCNSRKGEYVGFK
jgi:hypothetical protein